MESLESRTLLAADLFNGLLTVVGTNGNDNIQVQVATSGPNAGQLQVDVNGAQSFFNVAQVGAIQVFGLKGNDQITVDDNVAINASIGGGKGNDTIKCGAGNDTVHGDAGNDTIDGSGGDDTLFGDNGNDSINGDEGDDTCHGNNGNDTLHGGGDDDDIHGDNGNDSVNGDGGDDTCHGDNGKDAIDGDDGFDGLYGDNGNDVIDGGGDDDYLDGGAGKDDCHGGFGDDQLKGGGGNDHLNGDDGDDLLDGDEGNDQEEDGVVVDLDNEFKAFLTGIGGEFGTAEYEIENEDGQLLTKFELEVHELAANSAFNVVIGGVTVGQINTDALGSGEFKLCTVPTGDELPFPAGFPTIGAGTTILVGVSLEGSFAASFCI
jgi:Ca2+-binding RTX toxin-like protein